MLKCASSIASAFLVLAAAAPVIDLGPVAPFPNLEVCTGDIGTGCVIIPISSDSCVDFTGGLSFFNKEVSSAVIPEEVVCIFFEPFGCLATQLSTNQIILPSGTWDFHSIPGTNGTIDFNDASSSLRCFPNATYLDSND